MDGYTSGDMSLKLDEGRDKSKDVVNKENPDGTRPPDMAPGGPKHGKWDGQEHIGGNQFAGGSGGTGTAGPWHGPWLLCSSELSVGKLVWKLLRHSIW